MKTEETKEKFIEMRAGGMSYEEISKKLDTSARTLIKWSKKFNSDILNLKQIKKECILKQFALTEIERLKKIKKLQDKLSTELENRTFEDISTAKLIELHLRVLNELQESEVIEFINIEESLIHGDNIEIKWKS